MIIQGTTRLVGSMGWPISHTRSPRLHGFWFDKYKIDGACVALGVHPDHLAAALRGLSALNFRGTSVTLPHKENVLKLVDEVEDRARRVGAVNLVVVQPDGSLLGRNTDVIGFSENLKSAGFKPGGVAVVLGAGGAARAALVALQEMGMDEIRIVNRSRERAEIVAREAGVGNAPVKIFNFDEMARALDGASLLANTTSLGMVGQATLDIDLSPLPQSAWVTDAVYTPLNTPLLQNAAARGHRVVDGLGMLLNQAAPAFEAWFGVKPEVCDALRLHMQS